jgi:hypothetical protein
MLTQYDNSLANKTKYEQSIKNVWLGDSGASCHMCKSDEGYINYRDISTYVQLGNGQKLKATKIGINK